MKRIIVLSALLCVAGCASLGEDAIERREYRNVDWQNRYIDYRERCRDAGGQMLFDARSGAPARGDVPRRGDYYACTRRIESSRAGS